MEEDILAALNEAFPNKGFLSKEEVVEVFGCRSDVIQNWIKRGDKDRRPPRLTIGKRTYFPKKAFARWLNIEQSR